jgi:molybdopterin-guanine dinucleotide biosynthesis protein A
MRIVPGSCVGGRRDVADARRRVTPVVQVVSPTVRGKVALLVSLTFSAVLLAAGRSTRMGRDKALLEIEGEPLWRRQQAVLRAAGATEIFLSARPDQAWAYRASGFTAVLHDALPGSGPLVGLTAALERATHPHVAVLAIDLPRMTPGWFVRLAAECAPGFGAVGRRDGFFEPLAAIYPCELKWIAWEAIARDTYAVQPLVARGVEAGLLRVCEIGGKAGLFANWNTAADLGAAANALPSP